jgi:hypothetical protein
MCPSETPKLTARRWDDLCEVRPGDDVDSREGAAKLYTSQVDLFEKLVNTPSSTRSSSERTFCRARILAARTAIHSEYLETLGEEISVLGELLNKSKHILDHDDFNLKRGFLAEYLAVAASGDKLRAQTSALDARWRARDEALTSL